MIGDLYDLERRVFEEVRRNSGEMPQSDPGMDVATTLRAVVLLGSVCLALLGMCELRDMTHPPVQTAAVTARLGTGR